MSQSVLGRLPSVRQPPRLAGSGVPWWGVAGAVAAPVLIACGWMIAAWLQPRPYDPVTGTVSALAALGAADRWVMTLAFAAAGTCEVAVGLALRPDAVSGRLILVGGGVAGLLVAASPESASGGSLRHALIAAIGLVAMTAWPGAARRRGAAVPWALRPAVAAAVCLLLLGLLAWFGAELATGGGLAGLAERVLGGAQTLWPPLVAVACRRSQMAGNSRAFHRPVPVHTPIVNDRSST